MVQCTHLITTNNMEASFPPRCVAFIRLILKFSFTRYDASKYTIMYDTKKGKGLEKVYLPDFGLRKVQKMTKNAETAKNTIQNVFDPSFFHTVMGRNGGRYDQKLARRGKNKKIG